MCPGRWVCPQIGILRGPVSRPRLLRRRALRRLLPAPGYVEAPFARYHSPQRPAPCGFQSRAYAPRLNTLAPHKYRSPPAAEPAQKTPQTAGLKPRLCCCGGGHVLHRGDRLDGLILIDFPKDGPKRGCRALRVRRRPHDEGHMAEPERTLHLKV